MLVGEPLAGPAQAGLDLVEDQQHAAVVAEPADAFEVPRRREVDPPFPLDRLEHDGGGPVVEGVGQGPEVVVRDVGEAGDQRLEAGVILGLGRGGERGVGPAVEAALHRHDLVPARGVAVGLGHLDGRLVRLRPAVAEEALAAERPLRERLGERPLGLDVPGVRHVDQLADLVADRLDHPRRAVPQQVAAPAGEEVEEPPPLGVPDP